MGYASNIITKHFPDIAEDGDDIWVTIRNPKVIPTRELTSKDIGLKVGADGEIADIDTEAAISAGDIVMSKIIMRWRAYDASWVPDLDEVTGALLPGQVQPMLTNPPTPDQVAKLPSAIYLWLGEQLAKANPQAAN